MRVYIAGPMTGYHEHNFPAFREAAETLRAHGWDVISPAEMDEEDGYEPPKDGGEISQETYIEFLLRDLNAIAGCDGIVLLPGWYSSAGAKVEYAWANALKLEVLSYKVVKRQLQEAVPYA